MMGDLRWNLDGRCAHFVVLLDLSAAFSPGHSIPVDCLQRLGMGRCHFSMVSFLSECLIQSIVNEGGESQLMALPKWDITFSLLFMIYMKLMGLPICLTGDEVPSSALMKLNCSSPSLTGDSADILTKNLDVMGDWLRRRRLILTCKSMHCLIVLR